MCSDDAGLQVSPTDGCWVLVVGPSGAGKDTLIEHARGALADDRRVQFARRVVTREPNRFEDHDCVSQSGFERLQSAGELALSWSAHGLSYGIHSRWQDAGGGGAIVVCNVSRTILTNDLEQLGKTHVVLVTAPPDVLRERIAHRGRDNEPAHRLQRRIPIDVPGIADLIIENTGTPMEGAAPLIAYLRNLAGSSSPGGSIGAPERTVRRS